MYIIIPTHNRIELLERSLVSFSQLSIPNSFRNLIVVENGGKFGVESLIKNLKNKFILYDYFDEGNKSLSLNYITQKLKPDEFLIFCDDDVRFIHDYLNNYHQVIRKYNFTDKVYFGGALDCDYIKTPKSYYHDFLPFSSRGISDEQLSLQDNYFFPGINWGCFNKVIIDNGGFSENYGPGSASGARGQESQFQKRIFDIGYKPILVPQNPVFHFVPPERSSFFWGLKRMYNSGLGRGMMNSEYEKRSYLAKRRLTLRSTILISGIKLIFYHGKPSKRRRIAQRVFHSMYELGIVDSTKAL